MAEVSKANSNQYLYAYIRDITNTPASIAYIASACCSALLAFFRFAAATISLSFHALMPYASRFTDEFKTSYGL